MINPIIVKLLEKRGITSREEMDEFLSDKPKKTYDPFLLPRYGGRGGFDFI